MMKTNVKAGILAIVALFAAIAIFNGIDSLFVNNIKAIGAILFGGFGILFIVAKVKQGWWKEILASCSDDDLGAKME